MALEVIGVGFGRTGTLSLRTALGELGFGCYHMMDVLFDRARRTDVDFWLDVAEDPERGDRDWDQVFSGLRATVDYPACGAWRGLLKAYPNAKFIFTHHPRGAEAWYDSNLATIYTGTGHDSRTEFGAKINAMMDGLIWNGMLKGTMENRDAAVARYHEHLAEVREAIPADQFLEFSVAEGWDPLCKFLEVPTPETAFPNMNEREQMAKITRRLKQMRFFQQNQKQVVNG